jgi:hypothetical protein
LIAEDFLNMVFLQIKSRQARCKNTALKGIHQMIKPKACPVFLLFLGTALLHDSEYKKKQGKLKE